MGTLVLTAGLVVTVDAGNKIIRDGAMAVRDGLIALVGPREDVLAAYPGAEVSDNPGSIVLPGFICTHSHMAGVIAHNLPLPPKGSGFMDLLTKWWWPFVEDQARPEDLEAAARFSAMRMLKTGTTCVVDMVEAPLAGDTALDVMAEVLEDVGMRAVIGLEVSDRLGPETGKALLERNRRFIAGNATRSLVKGCSAVHTAYSCTRRTLDAARELARGSGTSQLIHLAEIPPRFLVEKYGKTAPEYLAEIGFLGPEVVAAHCIHLTPAELDILAAHDVKISHTPMTNMRGGHGVAPVPDMLKRGLAVSLGHDSFFSLDLVECMRIAHLLHKVARLDRTVVSPAESLGMLTRSAARAVSAPGLGMPGLGSLEPGKAADFLVVEPVSPAPVDERTFPGYLITDLTSADIKSVFVGGKKVVDRGQVVGLDEERVIAACQERARALWERVGVGQRQPR